MSLVPCHRRHTIWISQCSRIPMGFPSTNSTTSLETWRGNQCLMSTTFLTYLSLRGSFLSLHSLPTEELLAAFERWYGSLSSPNDKPPHDRITFSQFTHLETVSINFQLKYIYLDHVATFLQVLKTPFFTLAHTLVRGFWKRFYDVHICDNRLRDNGMRIFSIFSL